MKAFGVLLISFVASSLAIEEVDETASDEVEKEPEGGPRVDNCDALNDILEASKRKK